MKVLEIWKAFNSTAKIVILILIAILAGSFVLSFMRESEIDRWREEYEIYRDSAQAAVEWGQAQALLADSALQFADSTNAIADSLTHEYNVLKGQLDAINQYNEDIADQNDSLFVEVTEGATTVEEALENTPEITHPWVELAFSLYQENSGLKEEIGLWKLQIDNLERRDVERVKTIVALENAVFFQTERADSLESVILNMPEGPPSEKLFGIIPLPSRKTSLIVGAIIGAFGTYTIVK